MKLIKYLLYSLWYRHEFPLCKGIMLCKLSELLKMTWRERQEQLRKDGCTEEEIEVVTGALRDVGLAKLKMSR